MSLTSKFLTTSSKAFQLLGGCDKVSDLKFLTTNATVIKVEIRRAPGPNPPSLVPPEPALPTPIQANSLEVSVVSRAVHIGLKIVSLQTK